MTEESTMTTMLALKGSDYVAAWPGNIARKCGVGIDHVSTAINTVIPGAEVSQFAFYENHGEKANRTHGLEVVGDLTPEQAKSVVAEVRRIKQAIIDKRSTHCHFCGLPLRNGTCTECD